MASIIQSGVGLSDSILGNVLGSIKRAITDIKGFDTTLSEGYNGTFHDGDGNIVTVLNGLIQSVEAPPSLRLTWDDIGNAVYTTVGDYNTAFGSDFTTLTVDGNTQVLTGNTTPFGLGDLLNENVNIESIIDIGNISSCGHLSYTNALITLDVLICTSIGTMNESNVHTVNLPSCTNIEDSTFYDCPLLTTVNLPSCTHVGEYAFNGTLLTTIDLPLCTSIGSMAFRGCLSLTLVNLPLCEDLGGTTGDDGVFESISGNTITLNIAASRATCNGGNPDGDIVYLGSNNTATINYI